MNGLSNTSMGAVKFCGKSHNKHPYWYNQPLRLSENQKENLALVFQDFFERYHLHEVRETLWEWLVEVISSQNSISNDGSARNNHVFFYEKLEELVEACFILQKGDQVKKDQDDKNALEDQI